MKTTKIIYKGVVITQQKNGLWSWYRAKQTLDQCKKEIDKEFKGRPPLAAFSL